MKPTLLIILITALSAACGGGSGGSSNQAPTIAAIPDQSVNEKNTLTITATASDSDGTIASYLWEQTSGTAVSLADVDSSTVMITAPIVEKNETIGLKLTVTDGDGATAISNVTATITDIERYIIDDAAVSDGTLPLYYAPEITNIDVDGDGLIDIIVGGAGYDFKKYDLQFKRNMGDGTYQALPLSDVVNGMPSIYSLVAPPGKADFNNDGYDDLYIATGGIDLEPWAGEQNILLLGSGNGLFLAEANSLPTELTFTHDYAIGDLNSDGYADILELNAPRGAGSTILINNGDATFTRRPDLLPEGVALAHPIFHPESSVLTGSIADFDKDGLNDIVLAGDSENIYGAVVYINVNGAFTHDNRFTIRAQYTGGSTPRVRARDINNDSYPDVFLFTVEGDYMGHVGNTKIYINNKDLTFTDETLSRLPFQSTDPLDGIWTQSQMHFVDLDNDDDEDIWFHGTSNNEIDGPRVTHFWLNDGTGVYAAKDLSNLNQAYQLWLDSGDAIYNDNGILIDTYQYAVSESQKPLDMYYTPILRENGFVDYLMLQSWCIEVVDDTCVQNTRAILVKDQLGE